MFLYRNGCANEVKRSTAIATVTRTLTLQSAIIMQYGTMHRAEAPFSGKPENSSCIPMGINTPTCQHERSLSIYCKSKRESALALLHENQTSRQETRGVNIDIILGISLSAAREHSRASTNDVFNDAKTQGDLVLVYLRKSK